MAISPLATAYAYSFTGLGIDGTSDPDAGEATGKQQTNSAYALAVGSSQANALLMKVFAEMKDLGVQRITFETLDTYRLGLEKSFSDTVRADLLQAGVDPDIDFKLATRRDGGIDVVTKSPDKAKIEKYLQDNPKIVEQFNTIQALSNLKKGASAKNSVFGAMTDIKTSLQATAVQAFFEVLEANGGMASQIADFSSDEMDATYGLGMNMFI